MQLQAPERLAALREGQATPQQLLKDVKKAKAQSRKEERASRPAAQERTWIRAPIEHLAQHVPAASVDVILTDPPYGKEFLPLWASLAPFAVHALKPGGSLLAMSGHLWLPEVFAALTQ